MLLLRCRNILLMIELIWRRRTRPMMIKMMRRWWCKLSICKSIHRHWRRRRGTNRRLIHHPVIVTTNTTIWNSCWSYFRDTYCWRIMCHFFKIHSRHGRLYITTLFIVAATTSSSRLLHNGWEGQSRWWRGGHLIYIWRRIKDTYVIHCLFYR